MKKLATLILALAMLLSLSAPALAEPVQLEMWTWSTEQTSGLTKMVDIFNEQHEGEIFVNLSFLPWNDMWTKLQASGMAQDATGADVYGTGTQYSYDYARNGWILDISDLYESGAIDASKYPDICKDLFTVDGKLIGVIKDYDGVGVFYNKALFDAAGVAYPADTWTWDEYIAACDALQKAMPEGSFATTVGASMQCFWGSLFYSNGGIIWDENNMCHLDSPENIEVMEAIYSTVEKGYSPTMDELAEVGAGDRFKNSTVAMLFDGSWATAELYSILGENLGVTTIPYFDTPKVDINSVAWVGNAYTNHPEEVKTFLTYLATYEAQSATHEVVIPAYEGTDAEWAAAFESIGSANFMKWHEDGSGFPKPMPTTHGMEAVTIAETAIADCLYEGSNFAEILGAAADESDALMVE